MLVPTFRRRSLPSTAAAAVVVIIIIIIIILRRLCCHCAFRPTSACILQACQAIRKQRQLAACRLSVVGTHYIYWTLSGLNLDRCTHRHTDLASEKNHMFYVAFRANDTRKSRVRATTTIIISAPIIMGVLASLAPWNSLLLVVLEKRENGGVFLKARERETIWLCNYLASVVLQHLCCEKFRCRRRRH